MRKYILDCRCFDHYHEIYGMKWSWPESEWGREEPNSKKKKIEFRNERGREHLLFLKGGEKVENEREAEPHALKAFADVTTAHWCQFIRSWLDLIETNPDQQQRVFRGLLSLAYKNFLGLGTNKKVRNDKPCTPKKCDVDSFVEYDEKKNLPNHCGKCQICGDGITSYIERYCHRKDCMDKWTKEVFTNFFFYKANLNNYRFESSPRNAPRLK